MTEVEATRTDGEEFVPVNVEPIEVPPTEELRNRALAERVYPLVAKVSLGLATQADIDAEYAAILEEYPMPEPDPELDPDPEANAGEVD